MDAEFDAVCSLLGGEAGVRGGNEFRVMRSGIGKVNAASRCTEFILRESPDCIISSGCAGGLDPSVGLLDAVVADECCYHDVWCGEPNAPGQVQGMPQRFICDRRLRSLAVSAAKGMRVHTGPVCSGDRFCTDPREIDAIRTLLPDAIAIDMESCALAQVCYMYGVPFVSVRIISDTVAAEGKDRFAQYKDFWSDVAGKSFAVLESLICTMPHSL